MFRIFSICPLCGSEKLKKYKNGYLNRYSEDISKDLNLKEKQLNRKISNFKCLRCSLIFKKFWFREKYLNYIFNKLIARHPKGWDKNSKKFTKEYFLEKFAEYKINKIFDKNNYFIRELKSIIDSIYSVNKIVLKKILFLKVKAKNLDSLDQYDINYLARSIKQPEPFKRFSGFGNKIIFDEIERVVGRVSNYAEIGCPLWGNFDFITNNKKKINSYFIKPDPGIFWGKSCIKNERKCINLLSNNIKIYNSIDDCINKKKKFDFLSAFLCLDHSTNPKVFLKKLRKITNSIGLILEPSEKGIPIQHFTGWNINSIRYLAKLNNFKIHDSSKLMSNINHKFIILY